VFTVVASSADQPSSSADTSATADAVNRLDVFFDLDDYQIRGDQVATIQTDAQFLKDHADMRIVVEGHCDEMGSTEYNLALGDKRAPRLKPPSKRPAFPQPACASSPTARNSLSAPNPPKAAGA